MASDTAFYAITVVNFYATNSSNDVTPKTFGHGSCHCIVLFQSTKTTA